jgi:hypothetical protein
MFLAGIIKTHADTEQEPKQQPAADESPATLDADAVADATWPSFKPRRGEPSRARWT